VELQINRPMTPREWAMLLALSFIWGGSFFFNSVALRELPPMTLVFARVAPAALVLVVVIYAMGLRLPRERATWIAFFAMGFLNNVVPFWLIGWGQTHIASGLASILNATTPLWTVIIAHIATTDEKMTGNRFTGVLLGLTGVAWMIGTDALQTLGANVLAQVAVVVAAIFYGISGVYAKRFGKMGIAPLVTATGLVVASTAMSLPLMLVIDRPWTLAVSGGDVWGAVLGISVVSTAFAYIIYFRILATAGATNLLLVTFLIPVGAILLGTLILNERLEPKHFIGMAMIGLGLAAIDGRALKRLWS
jgi:drug/metabolite transporter (DMT)-like permease